MRKETMMRGRRGFRGGCYGGGGDLMGFLAIILMAIILLAALGLFTGGLAISLKKKGRIV